MSPILVRPVREQLEHDRVIRLLQAKYKRKFDVAINPGHEQVVPVTIGTSPWYPDLVLQSADRGRRVLGTVEVETAESVNNLEAMSQWVAFAKLRVPFHLYVPSSNVDTARRLCADLQVPVAELWAYNALGDQMRFTLVQRAQRAAEPKPRPTVPARPAAKPRAPTSARTATKRPAAAAARTRPARPVRTAGRGAAAATRRTGAAQKSAARGADARKKAPGTARTQKRK